MNLYVTLLRESYKKRCCYVYHEVKTELLPHGKQTTTKRSPVS